MIRELLALFSIVFISTNARNGTHLLILLLLFSDGGGILNFDHRFAVV